jgi:anti-sigma B factor antagonist
VSAGALRRALPGELTIATVAESWTALAADLATGADLELDLSGVVELDTAGLQLLLMAVREADRTGARVVLTGAGEPVRAVLAIAHLENLVTDTAQAGGAR